MMMWENMVNPISANLTIIGLSQQWIGETIDHVSQVQKAFTDEQIAKQTKNGSMFQETLLNI